MLLFSSFVFGQHFEPHKTDYQLVSPNSKYVLKIHTQKSISYLLLEENQVLIDTSSISLQLADGQIWGKNSSLEDVQINRVQQTYNPPYGIAKTYENFYNELVLKFKEEFWIVFRMYDNGMAYRLVSRVSKELLVTNEQAEFNFLDNHTVYYPETSSFQTPFEKTYPPKKFGELENFCITPVLVSHPHKSRVLITEADLRNYPALFLQPTDNNGFKAIFPPYPLREKLELPGRLRLTKLAFLNNLKVAKTADYIAKIPSKHEMPWRVVLLAKHDKNLLDNYLIYNLGKPSEIKDHSWIKPGKVAWDWYNHWELQGVDYKTGINTQTYKYYIDFAAANGIEYVNFDEGWCDNKKLDKINKNFDFHYLVRYAHEKNVKVFVWMIWWVLDEKMEYYLDLFKKWNIDGLKVDFMDRGDQRVVEFYERLAKETAKRQLLLNLHGAYKPTGLERTYPNMINREGVIGLENNKFGSDATPEHNLSLPFTRMAVGQTDYTPGSMFHVKPQAYQKNWSHPKSMTTRCQQMAMYVVYYGPLQMLSEAPTAYERDSLVLRFLQQVPTVWDKTVPISGQIGKEVVVARRKNEVWYVGGMNAGEAMVSKFSLNFLEPALYEAVIYSDTDELSGCNLETKLVKPTDVLKVSMAENGGFVVVLKKKE